MNITVKSSSKNYTVAVERGIIKNLPDFIDKTKRTLVVTDDGVPPEYAEAVASQFKSACVFTIPQGEKSKSPETLFKVLSVLCEKSFDRNCAVAAVGGGVVGDLSGLAASLYMRGITFYNIPTTLLSQVDSSIGGKTAVDFNGYKNIVGSFYQPDGVVIDPNVLNTLPERQFNNGLAECIKMAATSDSELFMMLENNNAADIVQTVIERSLMIKKDVVEADEKENGMRRILNFGHTAAHAVESVTGMGKYLHGECVAIGMMPMASKTARERIKALLIKNKLPVSAQFEPESFFSAMRHDKKSDSGEINIVYVEKIGSCEIKKISFSKLDEMMREAYFK